MMSNLRLGDAREVLRALPEGSRPRIEAARKRRTLKLEIEVEL